MTRLLACESVTFWRDPVLADMEVLKATYVTHSFSRHSHEGYAIGTIESGAEAFTYRGMTYQAPAGNLGGDSSWGSAHWLRGPGIGLAVSHDLSSLCAGAAGR